MTPAPPTSLPSPAITLCHRAEPAASGCFTGDRRRDADRTPEEAVALQRSRLRMMLRDPQREARRQRGAAAVPHDSDGDGGLVVLCEGREAGVQPEAAEQGGLRGRSGRGARPRCPAPPRAALALLLSLPQAPQPGIFWPTPASRSPGDRGRRRSQERRLAPTRYFWSPAHSVLDFRIFIIVCET